MTKPTPILCPSQAPIRGFFGFWMPLFSLLFLFVSCGPDDGNGGEDKTEFNRQAMFTHIGGKIILPAYREMAAEAQSLHTLGMNFIAQPEAQNLTELQEQFQLAYLAFQRVKPFELGPATTVAYRTALSIYPVDESKIEDNIAMNSTDLDLLGTSEAKGFPALDFLLFGLGNNQAQLDAFSTDPNAQARKDYLQAILEDILDKSETVLEGWETDGGDYITTFITNTGTDVGSSMGLLVNEMKVVI